MKISFINEIADLCEAVDADVQDVARGIGLDNRIGPKFLHAGPGYGGSCFPKDTLALLQTADEAGVDQRIVRTTVEVNDDRKAAMADRVVAGARRRRRGQARRRARAGVQAEHRRHARRAVDPADQGPGRRRRRGQRVRPGRARAGREGARQRSTSPTMPMRPREAPTRWSSSPNGTSSARSTSTSSRQRCAGKVLVDLRNVYGREEAEQAGLAYYGVGRGKA